MSAVTEYAKKYPDAWEVSGYDPEGFLASLAEAGIIESNMIVPLLAQHQLAEKLAEPAAVHDLDWYITRYPFHWVEFGEDAGTFVRELYKIGLMPYTDYVYILEAAAVPIVTEVERKAITGIPLFEPAVEAQIEREAAARDVPIEQVRDEYVARGEVGDALFDKIKEWFKVAYHEVLVSLWRWMLEKLKDLIDLVVGFIKPKLEQAWDFAKARLEDYGTRLYDGALKMFEGHSPLRPEDAPALAVKLYMFAMGMGMAAHGTAAVCELFHPLKQVGIHQTAAAIGDFAGFGRISGATIGVLENRVLGQAMTYAVQDRFRPRIPHEQLLIELRSKREIDKPTFDKAMAYQGFDDNWIDLIERWQWKDPRMFEIIRLADVGLEQGPPPASEMPWLTKFGVTGERLKDWWLYRKFMRAGYEDVDLDVMVNFIHRREVAFALTYVRTAIRRNYRWGYLTDEELGEWMDRLKLPPQAKEWIFWAGELDREYFYRQDLQGYYVTAFRNDVIDDDELLVSLLAMNLPPREASLLVRSEKVRKKPKATVAVPAEQKAPLAKIQSTYIQLYREQFKKEFIDEGQYFEALIAIGIDQELAEAMVELDATKKVPAPAPP